jgi:hypothetical protein
MVHTVLCCPWWWRTQIRLTKQLLIDPQALWVPKILTGMLFDCFVKIKSYFIDLLCLCVITSLPIGTEIILGKNFQPLTSPLDTQAIAESIC